MIFEPDDLQMKQETYDILSDIIKRRDAAPRRMMHLAIKCSACSYQRIDNFTRQNPDRLVFYRCCPWCKEPMQLVKAIPYTTSDARDTRCDLTESECWQCGDQRHLHSYLFDNGVEVQLCQKHFKRYAKQAYKIAHTPRPTPEEIKAMHADFDPFIDADDLP